MVEEEKNLITHCAMLVLSRISLGITGIFFWWLALRLYSIEEVGFGSVLISSVSLLVSMATLGTVPTLVRFMPKQEDKAKIFGALLTFSTMLLFFLFFLFLVFQKYLVPSLGIVQIPSFAFIFLVSSIFLQLLLISEGLFLSGSETGLILLSNLIQNFSRLGLQFLFIPLGGMGIFMANSFAAALSIIMTFWYFTARHGNFLATVSLDKRLLRELLPFSVSNFLYGMGLSLPGLCFPIMIFSFYSGKEAAFFYIPWTIFSVCLGFIVSINSVFLMQSSTGGDPLRIGKKVFITTLVLGVFCFVLFYFAGDYILIFFRKDFSEGSFRLLKVFFLSIFSVIVNHFFIIVYNIKRQVREIGTIAILIIVTSFVFSAVLLPIMGIVGIGWGWFFSHLLANLYIGLDVLKRKRSQHLFRIKTFERK